MAAAAAIASLRVKKLSEFAQLPRRGSELAAGYDLYACVLAFPHANATATLTRLRTLSFAGLAPRSRLRRIVLF